MIHTERSGAEEAKNSGNDTGTNKSEEYKNFEDFARKIFSVPRSELEEQKQKEKRGRKKKRKPKNK